MNNLGMIKREQLPSDIQSRIADAARFLAEDRQVVFAYLFGGLASGRVTPLSDVDIAVYLQDTSDPPASKLALFDGVTRALGTDELDLVILNIAPISLAGRILQNKRLLVDKEPFRRHAYESLTLREFFDFQMKEQALFARRYGIGR
jgi:uncharacterized protein